jgi:phage terminase Nu1 subunit (DNA packaging protein)
MSDDATVTTSELARLLGVTPKTVAELAKGGIIERAGRGRWLLEASVSGYCQHLREQAAGRGGESGADVRARLGAARTILSALYSLHGQ